MIWIENAFFPNAEMSHRTVLQSDSLGTCLWPRGFAQRISMARTHDGYLDPSRQRIGFLQDPDDSLINAI